MKNTTISWPPQGRIVACVLLVAATSYPVRTTVGGVPEAKVPCVSASIDRRMMRREGIGDATCYQCRSTSLRTIKTGDALPPTPDP